MKIIIPGADSAEWTCVTTCYNCHAKLEINRVDLYEEKAHRRGCPDVSILFVCPCCKELVVFATVPNLNKSPFGVLPPIPREV